VNQNRLLLRNGSPFFETSDKGFGAGDMVCVCSMQDNIEMRNDFGEVGRV
jgi:hypothetical protein